VGSLVAFIRSCPGKAAAAADQQRACVLCGPLAAYAMLGR